MWETDRIMEETLNKLLIMCLDVTQSVVLLTMNRLIESQMFPLCVVCACVRIDTHAHKTTCVIYIVRLG